MTDLSSSLPIARILRDQARHSRTRYRRLKQAQSTGTVTDPLEIDRPCPVATRPANPSDRRPPAHGKNPCGRCGTRGDLGCEHYAPCEPITETL